VKTEISPVGGLSTSENNFGKAKENLMALLHCLLAVTDDIQIEHWITEIKKVSMNASFSEM